jgi:hypothetical protein
MIKRNGGKTLSFLVKQIKDIALNNAIDIKKIMTLSQSIFKELNRIKANYRKQINREKSKVHIENFEQYIAEEEIIISLLFLLQEKIVLLHDK